MTLTVTSAPPLDDLPGIRYGFFGSRGGVSTGIYTSLNAGPGSRDDPDAVAENRRRVADELGVAAANLVSVFQIHSDQVVTLDDDWDPESRPRCDAMVTNRPGLALGVLTANLQDDPAARLRTRIRALLSETIGAGTPTR